MLPDDFRRAIVLFRTKGVYRGTTLECRIRRKRFWRTRHNHIYIGTYDEDVRTIRTRIIHQSCGAGRVIYDFLRKPR